MARKQKLYRVNESEHFNLMSMYEHLLVMRDDARECGDIEAEETAEGRIWEVEKLLDEAWCVGARVDWPTLKRIREIREERQNIRYAIAIAAGVNEQDAAYAYAV